MSDFVLVSKLKMEMDFETKISQYILLFNSNAGTLLISSCLTSGATEAFVCVAGALVKLVGPDTSHTHAHTPECVSHERMHVQLYIEVKQSSNYSYLLDISCIIFVLVYMYNNFFYVERQSVISWCNMTFSLHLSLRYFYCFRFIIIEYHLLS